MLAAVTSQLVCRRLFNLVTVPTLLLCVRVVALWVRSYFRHDVVRGYDLRVTPGRCLECETTAATPA